jgi:hypothetical protein
MPPCPKYLFLFKNFFMGGGGGGLLSWRGANKKWVRRGGMGCMYTKDWSKPTFPLSLTWLLCTVRNAHGPFCTPLSNVISHAMPMTHCVLLRTPPFSFLLFIIKKKLQLWSGNSIWIVSTEMQIMIVTFTLTRYGKCNRWHMTHDDFTITLMTDGDYTITLMTRWLALH